ncbi:MAG: monovalent cation:proton antiporter-2 (CPA2) family protein [Paracoccus sp. (in: a-proteobacteria)]|uniref:monovalent cation:proton antiporter-2 (CPA2) family protein n=1 Tax=Paracoccus sp. TaxID=267 RepID=UPI0026E043D1|nr:monovalent cation:proton antiporter-2 (CPA2) family protein [Paracoccus sp. (in: a-proteobacteria)]MDO5620207.1 monovalent cation:proton antiporter-2 (CPA2) family protein [Paracoccus sp. (in: a-proteobacteria)]
MAEVGLAQMIGPVVVLAGAAVVAVPLFRRIGLGSVLGYFAAGALVGPSVLGLFSDPASILHFAELGVVMFLFVIGLELRPSTLWSMRGQIFGLGLAQVLACIALLTAGGILLFGFSPAAAFVGGAGFVMSSTAVIMSILQERGEIASGEGQKAVSILLFEDLMIVPLLAFVAMLSPVASGDSGAGGVLLAAGALVALIVAGRYLLDPFFALLARSRTREVLTAGALLIVLGSALLMETVGLSMAMGAFIAGVLLSGSSYRHQIETDIEPFRGLLMGLFFMAVGMSLDLRVLANDWPLVLAMLVAAVLVKAAEIYGVARLFGSTNRQALHRTSMFAQGGEFAFVLFIGAVSGRVITDHQNALFSTVVILSMALTPLILIAADRFLKDESPSMEGVEEARDLHGQVLMIGFGRFGQLVSQVLLRQRVDVSVIETDPELIRIASRAFGFKIFYGDGSRLDVLHHSGAADAEVIMVCVNDRDTANRITELVRHEFPMARLLVRSYDRRHSVDLIRAGVDFEVRETLESAFVMGAQGLRELGSSEDEVRGAVTAIRQLDAERLSMQVQGENTSGLDRLVRPGLPMPEPLTAPCRRKTDDQGDVVGDQPA